jgi:hypothetical protein
LLDQAGADESGGSGDENVLHEENGWFGGARKAGGRGTTAPQQNDHRPQRQTAVTLLWHAMGFETALARGEAEKSR